MAPINKKLIHFNSEKAFNNALANDQIKDTSIVLVGDHANAKGKKIYSHGETYYTSYTGTDGVSVQNDKIGLISDNILFFKTQAELNNVLEMIGGEEHLPVPCVIYVNEDKAVYYNS